MKQLVLASASPRRKELFGLLGLPFVVRSVETDETPRPNETPEIMVSRLSATKAAAACDAVEASGDFPEGALIVAADTIVVLDGEVLGKPQSAFEAEWMLDSLRGRTHQVHTAVTLAELPGRRAHILLSTTDVWMRLYSDAEIAAYVESGDPMDKAGAYAIQNSEFRPVERIEGCYTGVVGLPLKALLQGLVAFGITPPVDVAAACRQWTGEACCLDAPVAPPVG
jgi:septum formation protein